MTNLTELQEEAFKNPIAHPSKIDSLNVRMDKIKKGHGYTIITKSQMSDAQSATQIVEDLTAEEVTPICLDIHNVSNASTALQDYRTAYQVIGNNETSPYLANTARNIDIEETVSFGDMFSAHYQNYNVLSHMKVVDDGDAISKSKKNTLIADTINATALEIDVSDDVTKCLGFLQEGKADMVIFKINTQSKQKLGFLLDEMVAAKAPPVLACHVTDRVSNTIKETTTQFIEECRERGLHPGGFVYHTKQDPSVFSRLADDLTRYIPNKNETRKQKELVAKNLAWS